MPRRNRNAQAIRPDPDQLADDLAHLAADLHHIARPDRKTSTVLTGYLAAHPLSLLTIFDTKQAISGPIFTAESR